MNKTALVIGASSQLGVFLLPRLVDAGFRVVALSRKAPAEPLDVSESVRWVRIPGENEPFDHLVSCGPLDLASKLIARGPGLRRVIAFSTTSVLTKVDSENRQESGLMARILADEQALGALCEERDIALTLIRPTLVYGCGLDRNISLMVRIGQRFGFMPMAVNARGLRQPVHADDLAELAVRCLLAEPAMRLQSAACGGSTISYREMLERTAAVFGGKVRTVALNTRLLILAVGLVARLPGFRGVNPEMVRRQGKDMVFDDSVLRKQLDYEPRPFQPEISDFEIPAFARRLQLPAQGSVSHPVRRFRV